MSTMDVNKMENEEENKTPDKKQIEAEEKEVMLKSENEPKLDAELADDGPVKAALSSEITDQGREVKPKFIPIGAIKMPGFFTRNSDKSKDDDGTVEKDGDNEKDDDGPKAKRPRLQFLHTCPFTQFLHHPKNENAEGNTRKARVANIFNNIKYPKIFQRSAANNQEAALASMETLDDKVDSPNDGMENVKLELAEAEEGKVATKLPLKERIRQKKFIIDDIVVCALVLLVLLVVIIGIVIGARAGPPKERPLRLGRFMTTLTSCGPVEGVLDDGVYNFYGIPYAVPPVGERRFTYAQPLTNISMCWNGTLQAHVPTPLCLQILENRTITGEEDCLTLDVTTPHVRYDSPLPVVVLIGANTMTGGVGPAQPSALYARTKEIVFVRPNFRLGPFGFLALDVLSNSQYPPTSGNYGLSDLLAVLQWVKYNIKHFGGDPESVTLFGHRAGATLTAALTTVLKAQKLYTRVWLASPSVIFPGEPLELAEKNNELFKQRSKCYDVHCLRKMSSTEVLSNTPPNWFDSDIDTMPKTDEPRWSWLVLDGLYLREHAYDSWKAQKKARESGKEKAFKPMVFGTTIHAGHSDTLAMKHMKWTPEILQKMVNESVIKDRNLTASVYEHIQFNKSYEGLVELISAVRTVCPLVALARIQLGAPLYIVEEGGAAAGGEKIVYIDADVQAILGTFDSETAEQRRFMAAMQQMFYYYVWHGHLPGPEPSPELIGVGQDPLPRKVVPACDLLISKDIVPRYAHIN